jgi:hypothetical protein
MCVYVRVYVRACVYLNACVCVYARVCTFSLTHSLSLCVRASGCDVAYEGRAGSLPLCVRPTGLRGGHISLAATVSSQYVSAVLMAAPLAAHPVSLTLTGGAVVSEPYIAMTVRMMQGARQAYIHTHTYAAGCLGKNANAYVCVCVCVSLSLPLCLSVSVL